MEAQISNTLSDGIFQLDRIIPPLGFTKRPIAVQLLLRKLRPEFLKNETGVKISEGIDHDEFIQLVVEHTAKGHDRGLRLAFGRFNVAAVQGTDYTYAVSFGPEGHQHDDAQRIGDGWLIPIPKDGFSWCRPGTMLFHYA